MKDKYYSTLLDDAQQFIGLAERKLDEAKDMLRESGSPGLMLHATLAKDILMRLTTCRSDIDDLPSGDHFAPPQPKQKDAQQ